MGLFSSKPAEAPRPQPHYVDVSMVKGSGWQFNHSTEAEARATMQRIMDGLNNGDKALNINGTIVNLAHVKSASYRDYYRTYYC